MSDIIRQPTSTSSNQIPVNTAPLNVNNKGGVYTNNASNTHTRFNWSNIVSNTAIGGVSGGWIGAGIGAALGLASSFFDKKYNEKQVKKQNKFNAEQAELANKRSRENMSFANSLNSQTYETYFSPLAQKKAYQDAGLSFASTYNTGLQGQGGNISATTSQAAQGANAPTVQAANYADIAASTTKNVETLLAASQLKINASKVAADNVKTLADAENVSINNQTQDARNISELVRTYAEVERLKAAGVLDDARAKEIYATLDDKISLLKSQSRLAVSNANLSDETAKNKANLDLSEISKNKAQTNLSNQQTATEKFETENRRFMTYRNDLAWTTEKNKHLVCVDLCKKFNISNRYASTLSNVLESASKQAGVSLVDIPTRTLFSWADFGNWKNIITAKMFNNTMRQNLEDKLAQDMRTFEQSQNSETEYYNSDGEFIGSQQTHKY